jgi:hypothetical protein
MPETRKPRIPIAGCPHNNGFTPVVIINEDPINKDPMMIPTVRRFIDALKVSCKFSVPVW